jgi:hypothetical protein
MRNEQERKLQTHNPLFNPYNKTTEEKEKRNRIGGKEADNTQRQAQGISESRIVLYKKGQLLPPKDFFIVEISTEGDTLMVAAFSVTTSESYLIEKSGKRA